MTTVTGYTAAHMDTIKNATIVGATVTGDNLILTKFDTTTVNAGNVRGPIGTTPTVAVGTTTTGSAGSSAAVTNSGTSTAAIFNFAVPAGAAATLAVGTVTTGAAGSSATVTNSGSSSAATLNFAIPQGNVGTAATIAVGTVTTGAAGSSTIVTNSGSSSAATFNFTIPKGDTGVGTPTGALVAFAGATAPEAWLLCDGSLQLKSSYSDLWTLIGSTYGAATSTHFYLPDLRGRVAAGKDNMGGTSASRLITNVAGGTLGSVGGVESQGLTAAQTAAHSHPNSITDLGHNHTSGSYQGLQLVNAAAAAGGSFQALVAGAPGSTTNLTSNNNTTAPMSITNANNTGTGAVHNNTQPTIVLNYIIKT